MNNIFETYKSDTIPLRIVKYCCCIPYACERLAAFNHIEVKMATPPSDTFDAKSKTPTTGFVTALCTKVS
jgi:hypothetical protein